MEKLGAISEAVITGKLKEIREIIKDALAEKLKPLEILNEGLLPGMDEVGRRFKAQEYYIPEVLLSAAVMKAAMEVMKPLMVSGEAGAAGKVVIGTVKGDLHDIGKNIVITLLEGAGYKVIDLGIDVPRETFLRAVKEEKPLVLGMSAMLTTTMMEMKKVIDFLSEQGIRKDVKVIVGGAPLTPAFVQQIGADGYGEDAVAGVELVKKLFINA